MKKLILILVLCLSVTTLLAKPIFESKTKTESILSIEKLSDVKQVAVLNYEFSAQSHDVFRTKKHVYDFSKDAVIFSNDFLDVFQPVHNYSYRERLKSNYILDRSKLHSCLGLKSRESNYR